MDGTSAVFNVQYIHCQDNYHRVREI